MRVWWIAVAIAFGVLLTACTKTIEGVSPESRDPCEAVQCSNGNVCISGTCACPSGTKDCNNACIPEASCCSSKDCGFGKECENSQCVKQKIDCSFLQAWNNQTKDCECSPNAKFCAGQAACIPKTACCDDTACKGSYKCAPTKLTIKVCLKAVYEQCKTLIRGEETVFSLPEEHSVRIDIISEDSIVSGYIDGEKLERLHTGEALTLSNSTTLKAETISSVGGTCKEAPR